jgi:hypothetical protein
MSRRAKWIGVVVFAPFAIALMIFVGGEIVKYLWNWLVPSLFGWRTITFWEAFGLLALCRILFGSHGFRGGRSNSSGRGRMADRMADRVADRWDHMTPEERERFRQRMRERCGFDPGATSGAL